MIRIYVLFFLLIYSYGSAQVKRDLVIPPRAKIGLSLSGGGAKGFAHIGVLKVLDSLGIKVDYIAGTSMGAVIGGLYATGYTGKQIEDIVLNTDFYSVLNNNIPREHASFFNKNVDKYLIRVPIQNKKIILPSSIATGQKNLAIYKELFKNYSSVEDFDKLPIPFMCIATNLETGKVKQLEHGDLSKAILASSAFPGLIDPVKIGDSLYIDGGITINYPSEPLKKKGMDIVIGVNLDQGFENREQLTNIVSILNQIITFGISRETKKQLPYTDINIQPVLEGVTVTSFNEKENTIKLGYNEAIRYSGILKDLPKRENSIVNNYRYLLSEVYKIDDIKVTNDKVYNEDYILGKMSLKIPSYLTYGKLNRKIDQLYATNNYNFINYNIINHNGKNTLYIDVDEDKAKFFLKFGLHYDEVFKTGLLANITARRALFKNSIASFDFVFGDKPRYYFNYLMDNGYIPGFGIFSSYIKLDLKDDNNNISQNWDWYKNEVYLQSIWNNRYAVGFGLSSDVFSIYSDNKRSNSDRYNPYFFIKSDTQDNLEFPTKGIYIDIVAKALNVFGKKSADSDRGFQILGNIKLNFKLSKRISYQINSFVGTSFGDIPEYYLFRLGGIFEQNLSNFVSLEGYQFGQKLGNNALRISNSLQYKLYKNYYIIANYSTASLSPNINNTEFFNFNYNTLSLTAGYNSPFGQIKFNYAHALDKNTKGILSVILGHWF